MAFIEWRVVPHALTVTATVQKVSTHFLSSPTSLRHQYVESSVEPLPKLESEILDPH